MSQVTPQPKKQPTAAPMSAGPATRTSFSTVSFMVFTSPLTSSSMVVPKTCERSSRLWASG